MSRLRIDSLGTKTKYFDVVHHLANWMIRKPDSVAISTRFTPDTLGELNDTLFIANSSPTSPQRFHLVEMEQ